MKKTLFAMLSVLALLITGCGMREISSVPENTAGTESQEITVDSTSEDTTTTESTSEVTEAPAATSPSPTRGPTFSPAHWTTA